MKKTVVIVGGGITGLTAAYRLAFLKKQHNLDLEIILLEASNRLGGVIKSEAIDDYIIEHGPDAFLADRPEMKSLLAELNLDKELLPTNKKNRRAFIASQNKLVPLPIGFYMIAPTNLRSLFKSKLFSLPGKLRIAFETWLPAKKDISLDESAADFIVRRFGKELLRRAGEPLIGSIYMADVHQLSAQSTLSHFTTMEQKNGSIIKGLAESRHHNANTASGARYNLFASFPNGVETIIRRLKEELTETQIYFNSEIQSIVPGQNKAWALLTTKSERFEADAVIFATPAKLAADILSQLDHRLSDELLKIETIPSVVVNLQYKQADIGRKLDGFGFVVPTSENKKFMASGWISKKFSQRSVSGYESIRVFLGGTRAPELCDLPEKQLIDLAHNQLAPYLQLTAPPQKAWLIRWSNGLPFYKIGHAQIVRVIETYASVHPGLYFAGASYNGLGIPDCVRSAEVTVAKLTNFLLTENSTI